MEQPKRVGIWIRVSTDMQVKEESPAHHEARAQYYCKSHDWHVVEVYRLEAVSGKSVIEHPEAKRMLADIRSKHISGLVFSKLARLARSTKELLEFAEIFRKEGADLVSLSENIDTSSAAGRLFFTIISAMAEWEREEIAARVAASVPIRARMGKPLGGQASLGYKWVDKQLVIDEAEAPVRKQLYELFMKLRRKKTVAKALNDSGFRTRNGSMFTDTTIERLLRDPTAKGTRLANYTKSVGEGKHWQYKPQEDWITMPCPAVVSPQLWDERNQILDMQFEQRKKPGKPVTRLLFGFIKCSCGKAMYVFHEAPIYVCKACKNRIAVDDIDDIYQRYLEDYLGSIDKTAFLEESLSVIETKKALLATTNKDRTRLSKRMSELLTMRLDGELSKDAFAVEYKPMETRVAQLELVCAELEADIDIRNVQLLSTDSVLTEAKALYEEWSAMPFEQKRGIVETITSSIEIGQGDITITLSYAPALLQNGGKGQRNFKGSCLLPT
jgi:site-specific DNA recombinase